MSKAADNSKFPPPQGTSGSDLNTLLATLSPGAKRVVRSILRGNVPGWYGKCVTEKEAEELQKVGLYLQIECNHMDPRHCYPLQNDGTFERRAKELGLSG